MGNFHRRQKINRRTATVTAFTTENFDSVIPVQSGIAPAITQLFVTNNENALTQASLYEESSLLLAPIVLGASGTFVWDIPAGGQLELAVGSGLFAATSPSGSSVSVTAFYVNHNETTPVLKSQARADTFNGAVVIRKPKFGGGQ